MASLKEKITNALTNSTSGIIEPIIELEESSSHKVGGFVISNTFLDMDQLDRQNKIWDYLESVLQQEEVLNIVSLVTVTPDEADIGVS